MPILRIEYITHTYDPGVKVLTPTNSNRDIERKSAPGISYTTHKYDPGAKGLSLKNTDRDVRWKADTPHCRFPALIDSPDEKPGRTSPPYRVTSILPPSVNNV